MLKSADRVLLEVLLDQSLRGFADDPHRELRKLVDLGRTLVHGPAQKEFFELAARMLQDEGSPYYALITRITQRIRPEAIKRVGIAVGYDGWTKGAACIRRLEAERGYDIPWTLIFETGLPEGAAPLPRERLASILAQARQMGLHSFFFRQTGAAVPLADVLALADEFTDCGFFLLVRASELPADAARTLAARANCVTCLEAAADCAAEELAGQLGRLRAPYGLWAGYDAAHLPDGPQLAACTELAEEMGAPLLLLAADPGCTPEQCRAAAQLTLAARMEPQRPVLAADLYSDVLRIDRIISSGGCLVQIWPDGQIAVNGLRASGGLDRHTLQAVLAAAGQR